MSNYESEWGTIKVPTAELPRLRKAMQQAMTAHKERVFDATQTFWRGLSRPQKTNIDAYRAAVSDVLNSSNKYGLRLSDEVALDVYEMLHRAARRNDSNPRRVLREDLDLPTNRTTSFAWGEASVHFDRDQSTVWWEVSENNHAVDTAHKHPLTKTLFAELDKVRWTRHTGGVIEYRSEYQDSGPSTTTGFGPIGMATAPNVTRPFVDSQGAHWSRADLDAEARRQWQIQHEAAQRIAAGLPRSPQARKGQTGEPTTNRGHFGSRRRGDSGLYL